MALPTLSGDIELNDKSGPAFQSLIKGSEAANKALAATQQKAAQLQEKLRSLNFNVNTGGGGQLADVGGSSVPSVSEVLNRLPQSGGSGEQSGQVEQLTKDLGEYTASVEAATDPTTGLAEAMGQLGTTRGGNGISDATNDLKELAPTLADAGDETDVVDEKMFNLSRGLRTVAQIGRNPLIANALPGAREVSQVARLGALLPEVSGATIAFVGSLAAVAVVGAGAVVGLNAVWEKMRELEQQEQQKVQIGITFKTDNVDKEIATFTADLDERVSKSDALKFFLKVDTTSALADLTAFDSVAQTVIKTSDKFGIDWKTSLDKVIDAIDKGDGAFLEQSGFIDSAQGALNKYALEHGKTQGQLSKTERQQALINEVLAKGSTIAEAAATPLGHLREANEHLGTAYENGKEAFGNWVAALLDPTASSLADFWAGQLDKLTAKINEFNGFLDANAGDRKLSAKLSPEGKTNFDNLGAERDKISGEITDTKARLDDAHVAGNTQKATQLGGILDALQARLDTINAAIKQARDEANQNKPLTPLPKSLSPEETIKGADAAIQKINVQYEKDLAAARGEVATANTK